MNTRWLIKNWFRVGHKISWKLNFQVLGSLLYFNPLFQREWVYRIIENKHKYVLGYLKDHYGYLLDKYRAVTDSPSVTGGTRRIWVMWWQGEENAPELVKACIASMRRNANGAEVVVITKHNFREYADIPQHILDKHELGYVSFAQLSDIMRVYLISRHGGLWLDSTVYVSKPIPDSVFDARFYSQHTKYKKTAFVQNDRIHCFIIGGAPGSKLFMFEREFLADYWRDHDVIIDYYLLDYSIMLAYWSMDDIRQMIDSLEYTSEGLYELEASLDSPYDPVETGRILEENLFSKLVWNKRHKKERGGMKTVYGFLLGQKGF